MGIIEVVSVINQNQFCKVTHLRTKADIKGLQHVALRYGSFYCFYRDVARLEIFEMITKSKFQIKLENHIRPNVEDMGSNLD